MKILYTTDLHGDLAKYHRLVELMQRVRPEVVINGGDMLPKGGTLQDQGAFITKHLVEHFSCFEEAGIPYLCCLGNDDLRIWDELFDATCCLFDGVYNLAQQKVSLAGTEFIGMNWVPDYPFRLKDRCRMDTPDFVFPAQLGSAILSTPEGWAHVPDWFAYARTLPTIADELAGLPCPEPHRPTVYVIHTPPGRLGLDVCLDGRQVGSQAVYEFLETAQPSLSFHGHIHESPEVSGIWKARRGGTVCVQPGQRHDLTYVLADLVSMQIERYTE